MTFIIILFFSFSLFAQQELQQFLDIDRFHAYLQSWSQTMKGRGKTQLVEKVSTLTPKEIADLKLPPERLSDAFFYDDIILEYIQKKSPELQTTKADVAWGYDFYKRKLNEAYKITSPKSFKPTSSPVVETKPSTGVQLGSTALNSEEVLLNVDGYVANRTTRGVFWEASQSQRRIELHVGSFADFKEDLARRGATILGEVKTEARNYNPIYLVKDPGAKDYHYAITQISGQDRVTHLSMQSALVRWEGSKGKLSPPPPVSVVGDAAELLRKERATLTQVLTTLPKADQVVIGQKGAFERTFGSMAKALSVLEIAKQDPQQLNSFLKPNQIKLITKLQQNPDDLVLSVMKNASEWDKIYESSLTILNKLNLPLASDFTVFDLDRGSYEMSDYVFKTPDGQTKRWRIFSNSWGDEVLPIAHALKDTGHTQVTYIGTAGSLTPEVKVGDLVVPENVYDSQGNLRPIYGENLPEGAKKISAVSNVASPFEETGDWLHKTKQVAQAVEVETGHLARVFNSPSDKLTTMLLISDAVGVEGETLAEAESSVRRNAQIRAISTVIDQSGGVPTSPVLHTPLSKIVDELTPGKDVLYKYHIQRIAQLKDIDNLPNQKKIIEDIIAVSPAFTTSKIESTLSESGIKLRNILSKIDEKGILPQLSIDEDFLNGTWNPKKPIKLHLKISSQEDVLEVQKILEALKKQDKKLASSLLIEVSTSTPKLGYINLSQLPDSPSVLMDLYKDSALGFGGLASTETRSGGLKFVQVAPPTDGKAVSSTAFFNPNDEVKEILSRLKDRSDGVEILNKRAKYLNNTVRLGEYKYVIKEVDSLPNGALAQIVPEYPKGESLNISVYITPEGAKNPAVVLEELIHMDQITGSKKGFYVSEAAKISYSNPYHWAETVANAQAGSQTALRKLASTEFEALIAVDKNYASYFSTGLFDQDDLKIWKEYFAKRKAQTEQLYKDATKELSAQMKIKKAEWEKQRLAFDALEAQEDKLNHLIAKNDRKGVRELLEKYLPWPLMEPTEQKAWKEWLDAIEHPNPNNTELVFRGLDGETILKNAEGKPYLMSTVLTKNQGNYTRRLRSLTTMREKFGSDYLGRRLHQVIEGGNSNITLSNMMLNHADDPKGSPFLSSSNDMVATRFGSTKKVAILIDKKRLLLNGQAIDYSTEFERLIPLIVFPDEIIHLEDKSAIPIGTPDSRIQNEEFIKQVEQKLGRSLTPTEKNTYPQGEKGFINDGIEQMKSLILDQDTLPKVGRCSIQGNLKDCNCVFSSLNLLLK